MQFVSFAIGFPMAVKARLLGIITAEFVAEELGRSRPAKPAALRLGLVAAWRRTHIVLISWCAGRKCSLNPHINNVCWQNITTERRQLLHNEYTH
jgi:hypothetical protein